MARRRRKTRPNAAGGRKRRRRRSNPPTAVNRRRSRRRNPARARSRHVRRNQPLNVRGIMNRVMQGVTDALAIVGGEAAANIGAKYIPVLMKETKTGADGTPVEVETQAGLMVRKLLASAAVAIGASFVFARQRDVQRFIVGGSLSSLVKTVVRPLLPTDPKSPFAGALSAGGRMVRLNAYPGIRGGAVAGYPLRRALRGYPSSSRPRLGMGNGGTTADGYAYRA